jgi:hypothetical protein
MSVKNSNDTIGNRTRDLPACSAVPQPTATLRQPQIPHGMASDRTPASTAADRRLLANNAKLFNFEKFVSWKFRDHKSNGEVMLHGKATDAVGRLQVLWGFC